MGHFPALAVGEIGDQAFDQEILRTATYGVAESNIGEIGARGAGAQQIGGVDTGRESAAGQQVLALIEAALEIGQVPVGGVAHVAHALPHQVVVAAERVDVRVVDLDDLSVTRLDGAGQFEQARARRSERSASARNSAPISWRNARSDSRTRRLLANCAASRSSAG